MTDKVSLQKKNLAWRRMEAMVLLGEEGGLVACEDEQIINQLAWRLAEERRPGNDRDGLKS